MNDYTNELARNTEAIMWCAIGVAAVLTCFGMLVVWKLVECIAQYLQNRSSVDRQSVEIQERLYELAAAQMLLNNPATTPPSQKEQGQSQESQKQPATTPNAQSDFLEQLHSRYKKELRL